MLTCRRTTLQTLTALPISISAIYLGIVSILPLLLANNVLKNAFSDCTRDLLEDCSISIELLKQAKTISEVSIPFGVAIPTILSFLLLVSENDREKIILAVYIALGSVGSLSANAIALGLVRVARNLLEGDSRSMYWSNLNDLVSGFRTMRNASAILTSISCLALVVWFLADLKTRTRTRSYVAVS